MSWKGKTVRVKIVDDALEEYEKLNETVGKELSKGLEGSEYQTLFNAIKQKIEFLKDNHQYGTHIAKNKIPKEYVKKYDVNNLWKINLPGAWRMIYTVRGNEVEIISLILDIFDHKKYNKKFGYKKS